MDEERIECLMVLDWINGKGDHGVSYHRKHPEARTKWYILSMNWLKKWMKFNKLGDEISEEIEEIGIIDNEDIIFQDPRHHIKKGECIIRPDCRVDDHFKAIPTKAWKILQKIHNNKNQIIRKSIPLKNDSTMVELFLAKIKFLLIIDNNLQFEEPHFFHSSRTKSLKSVFNNLTKYSESFCNINDASFKLWKFYTDEILEKFDNVPGHPCQPSEIQETLEEKQRRAIQKLKDYISTFKDSPLFIPGMKINKSSSTLLESLELTENDLYIFEVTIGQSADLFIERDKRCLSCKRNPMSIRLCLCKKFYYCNDICEERDKNFHNCRKQKLVKSQYSRQGKVGLQNLGNTCYMNSGLQCLSNTKALTDFILSDQYLKDINRNNALGSKGLLIDEYSALVNEMWLGTKLYISPWGVKRALSKYAKSFEGYAQHDAQEMLGYLLDGMHEDLNRVKQKVYIEDPQNDVPEDQLAEKYWQNHKQRNDSIIVDLMHGMYKSELECPECNKVSIRFDPFLTITLPIPKRKIKQQIFIYVDGNEAVQGKVIVDKDSTAGEIRKQVFGLLGVENENTIMAELVLKLLKSVISEDFILHRNAVLIIYKQNDLIQTNHDDLFILIDFKKKSPGCAGQTIGIPLIFSIKSSATLKDLHKHIFQFMYKQKKLEIEEDFQHLFALNPSENYFSLKVHNPYNNPCCVCERPSCGGCPLSLTDGLLSDLQRKCREKNIRITVNLSNRIDNFSFMPSITNHSSFSSPLENNTHGEKIKISECFELFSRREQLDSKNSIYCSNCKTLTNAFKKLEIVKLPRILIIHLKRFKQKNHKVSRNNKVVEFPLEEFNMAQFCSYQQGIYDLYAVSNHVGSLHGGHYTATVKCHDGIWREFNDHQLNIVDPGQLDIGGSAYVLFYQRR